MSGDSDDRPDQTSTPDDLGSVGDWRLPTWAQRIPGLAWLFVGLAVADVIVELAFGKGPFAAPDTPDLRDVIGRVAHALPILLPAVIIARGGRRRPTFTDPLVAGSIAVALSNALGTVALIVRSGFTPMPIGDSTDMSRVIGLAAGDVAAIMLGIAGPILLGRAVLRHRRNAVPPWATVAGVAVFVMAGTQIALTIWWSISTSFELYASAFSDSGPAWLLDWGLGILSRLALVGWAYLAWAILSLVGDPPRPRSAWIAGVASILFQQVAIALSLALTALTFAGLPGEPTSGSETSVPLMFTLLPLFGVLDAASSVLFAVAFAAGLGSPRPVEPDAERAELEPLPNPG